MGGLRALREPIFFQKRCKAHQNLYTATGLQTDFAKIGQRIAFEAARQLPESANTKKAEHLPMTKPPKQIQRAPWLYKDENVALSPLAPAPNCSHI